MILEQEKQVNINLGFDTTDKVRFSEEDQAILFQMVTTNLYSRIEESVVREIVSNSWDAFLDAGKTPQPVIRFNREDRSLHFIDYGTGMSPEIINTVYKRPGKSTKRNNAQSIGYFGVGSKSISAYTDTFFITTRVDGVEYHYQYCNVANDLPDCDLIAELPTTEPNGTDIWFYLKESKSRWSDTELDKFNEAINNQLKYFDSLIVEGIAGFNNEYTIYRGTHYIARPDLYNVNGLLEICFGKVAYPIDFSALGISPIHCNLALWFQIGELTVTPNREQIKWTDTIKQRVLEKIELLKQEINELYSKNETSTDNLFYFLQNRNKEATIAFDEYRVNVHSLGIKNSLKFEPIKDLHLQLPANGYIEHLFNEYSLQNNKRENAHGGYFKVVDYPERFYYANGNTTVRKNKYIHDTEDGYYYGNLIYNGKHNVTELDTRYFYHADVLTYNPVLKTFNNPQNIDWKSEIEQLLAIVKNQVETHLNDYDAVTVPRATPAQRRTKLDEEICVAINGGKREYLKLEQLQRKAVHIFYCETEEEEQTLNSLLAGYKNRDAYINKKKRYYSNKNFNKVAAVIGRVPKKYIKIVKTLPNLKTYDDFFKSKMWVTLVNSDDLRNQLKSINTDLLGRFKKSFYNQVYSKHISKLNLLYYTIPDELKDQHPVTVNTPAFILEAQKMCNHYTKLFLEYQEVKQEASNAYRFISKAERLAFKVYILEKQLKKCQNHK